MAKSIRFRETEGSPVTKLFGLYLFSDLPMDILADHLEDMGDSRADHLREYMVNPMVYDQENYDMKYLKEIFPEIDEADKIHRRPKAPVPQVGMWIRPDGWHGDTALMESDWDGAEFRIESVNHPGVSMAVNIEITGRTYREKDVGDYNIRTVRVKIVFIDGDGKSYSETRGWLTWRVNYQYPSYTQ